MLMTGVVARARRSIALTGGGIATAGGLPGRVCTRQVRMLRMLMMVRVLMVRVPRANSAIKRPTGKNQQQ